VGYVTPAALDKLQPDTADNYELGVKGTMLNRFRYSADIFDIQWKNVQEGVQLTPLVLPASINVGNAFSRGFEMELEALLTQHFSTQLDYTYDQTRLTSTNPLYVYPNTVGSTAGGRQCIAGHSEEQRRGERRVSAGVSRWQAAL
jgi:outer membrane receptor protein involved in Fe transport